MSTKAVAAAEIPAPTFNISQFNSDPLQNRSSIVLSDSAGGSIAIYCQPLAGISGDAKEQIRQSAVAYLDAVKAHLQSI